MYEVNFQHINSGNISFFLTWCASYFCSNLFLLIGDGGKLLKQPKFLNPWIHVAKSWLFYLDQPSSYQASWHVFLANKKEVLEAKTFSSATINWSFLYLLRSTSCSDWFQRTWAIQSDRGGGRLQEELYFYSPENLV